MNKRYLILAAARGNPVPRIVNWYGRLEVEKINRKDYQAITGPLLLEIKSGRDVIYPDIITDPVLMVSEEAMEVIKLYDPQMPFLFLVLFDESRQESKAYFCPVLKDEAGEAVYRIRRTEEYEIRISEELAESLLDRGAVGMELRKCEV